MSDAWMLVLVFFAGCGCAAAINAIVDARPRRCSHVYSGHREHVRSAWVRHCEACGHAEVSSSPIPQPRPNRGANINPEPTYPRPPAPPAPPPRKDR